MERRDRDRWRGGKVKWITRQKKTGGKICTNPVFSSHFWSQNRVLFHFFPPHTVGQFHLWSIRFYDSRLNFSKVTSTWGILVFYDNSLSERKKPFLHTSQLLQWRMFRSCTLSVCVLCESQTSKRWKMVDVVGFIFHRANGDLLMNACYCSGASCLGAVRRRLMQGH